MAVKTRMQHVEARRPRRIAAKSTRPVGARVTLGLLEGEREVPTASPRRLSASAATAAAAPRPVDAG